MYYLIQKDSILALPEERQCHWKIEFAIILYAEKPFGRSLWKFGVHYSFSIYLAL